MTRELLMTQALDPFVSKGYAATTVDDIAVAAGTTRQTFYRHFPSKSHVMQALIETVDRRLTSADEPPLATAVESGDPAQLEAWLARKVDQWPEIRRT
jgi:AcrR family transcriptional regulator